MLYLSYELSTLIFDQVCSYKCGKIKLFWWLCSWLLQFIIPMFQRGGHSPWGSGYPCTGQLKGCPSTPNSVYSCSIPNQMQCSSTFCIAFSQLARWLLSRKQKVKTKPIRACFILSALSENQWIVPLKKKVPAGRRLYLKTSQSTSLLGSRMNGSRNMQTGFRYMSLLEPSAWYVLEPSKFHSGISEKTISTQSIMTKSISCKVRPGFSTFSSS